MQVFLLRGDPDYQVLRPADGEFWVGRSGSAVNAPWIVPQLLPYDPFPDASARLLPVDVLPLDAASDGIVLSGRAQAALANVLLKCGELWPVWVQDLPFWWFNCLACADVLSADTEGEWVHALDLRFLAAIHRLVFVSSRLGRAPLVFRVPELPAGYLFAREKVRDLVEQAGLIGFRFDLVWSASSGGVINPAGFGIELRDEKRALAKRLALRRS